MDPLQTYVLKIVKLGQGTLALYRRGQRLPDELAAPAHELLALENELGLPLGGLPAIETAGLEERGAASLAGEEELLVLDVEEEPGGGPVVIHAPINALPPLVVDVADEEVENVQREVLTPPAQHAPSRADLAVAPADDPGVCRRCGEALRPNSRFCHHCGQRRDAPI
jgi:hypothetical protein